MEEFNLNDVVILIKPCICPYWKDCIFKLGTAMKIIEITEKKNKTIRAEINRKTRCTFDINQISKSKTIEVAIDIAINELKGTNEKTYTK
jgi:hypothetical protein